jgi:hypothetical protein
LAGLTLTTDSTINPLCVTPGNCSVTNPEPVTVSSTTPNNSVDFGFDDPDIGDYVWHDADHDGIQDATESGIQGVTLLLYADADADGVIDAGQDNLIRTTTTDANGYYFFGGLPFSSFIIKVDSTNTDAGRALNGFSATLANQGADDSLDSDASSSTLQISITPTNPKDFSLDFGFYASTAYSVGNLVWSDADNDGFKDSGESGLGGVGLILYRDYGTSSTLDASDLVLGRTTTASDGSYSFGNLPAGNYLIVVNDLNGRLSGYQWKSSATDDDNYSHNPTYAFTIGSANIVKADFGYYLNNPYNPTAADMQSLSIQDGNGRVLLSWQMSPLMTSIPGFNIYRSTSLDGERTLVNAEPIYPSGLELGISYLWLDTGVQAGQTYYYWLEQVDENGITTYEPLVIVVRYQAFLPVMIKK